MRERLRGVLDWLKDLDTPTARGLARSYGPLAVVAAVFLLMASLVAPAEREAEIVLDGDGAALTGSGTGAVGVGQVSTGPAVGGDGGAAATGGGDGGSGAAPGAEAGEQAAGFYVPPGAQPCGDRDVMVPGDPYSPPCYTFAGDNGGATSRGVTDDEIIIVARELEGPSAAEIFSDISGESVDASPESIKATTLALVDYFNQRFQFYGRKLKMVFFKGKGNGASELLGGGQDLAKSDAIQVSQEIGGFAEMAGLTIPYGNALAQEGVLNFGAPYPSRDWFRTRRPYSWSIFPDSTNVVQAHSAWMINRMVGQPTTWAGDEYNGKPRRYAVVAPENAEYQEAVELYRGLVEPAGINIVANIKYKLDLSSMPNQASNIVAQLKDKGVTSVLCGCDPVMIALGLAPKSVEQNYNPEWVTAGLAFVDQDIVGQLIDERQWKRAFGIAYNARPEPFGGSYPYAAYKTARPDDEPSFGVEAFYYQIYMIALGIHMAGPDLTPATFERGMFNYPGGTGPVGNWKFGDGDWTANDDFREIWWDAERISPQNNKPGTWVEINGGARYLPGSVPKGAAPYFQ